MCLQAVLINLEEPCPAGSLFFCRQVCRHVIAAYSSVPIFGCKGWLCSLSLQ